MSEFYVSSVKHPEAEFYGIVMKSGGKEIRADDLVSDKAKVENLKTALECGKVTETTFFDIIEDFMGNI